MSRSVQKLIVCFYSGLQIKQEEEIQLSWDEQKNFLDHTILSPLVKEFPMNKDYCRAFFKKIIEKLEEYSEYVHDQLYESYCILMQSDPCHGDYCFRHYLIEGDVHRFVIIKESPNLIADGTTGLRTWEAALVLADWALDNKLKFQGKSVMELGSGLGMTGIVISKYCKPASFYFSDCHPRVLGVLGENIHINFPSAIMTKTGDNMVKLNIENQACSSISILTLDWNCAKEALIEVVPDIVIGADIVYDPSTFNALCNVFNTLITLNKDVEIFLASTIRNEVTRKEFLRYLDCNTFTFEVIEYKHPSYIYWNDKQEYCIMKIYKNNV